MVNPNWNITQQPNSFQQALGMGVQLGQRAKRASQQNALAAYAANPESEEAFQGLAKAAPEYAIKVQAQRAEAQRQKRFVELRRAALAGDANAQTELATQDNAAYNAMTTQQREQVDAQDDALANAAFQIMSAPPEQRAAIWDQQATNLGATEYVGQYSDAMMNTIVNRAGIQERLQKFQDPKYMSIPEGGTLVNVRDPQAISQFGGQPQSGPQGGPPPTNPNPQAGATVATTDQLAQVSAAFGGNTAKVQEWMAQNNVVEGKELNGQTYYRVNGQWYDNPEGR